MNVCFFGIYDPNYTRNRIIIKGLKQNRINVIPCRIDKNIHTSFHLQDLLKIGHDYLKLLLKYFKIQRRITIDVIIVGYPGWHVIPVIKIISLVMKKPIVFDAFISIYDSNVMDRRLVKKGSLSANLLFLIDQISYNWVDTILVDTIQRSIYFQKKFSIPKDKIENVYIGSDIISDNIFNKKQENFLVLFWGTFIPLHGIEYIIKAAKLLEDQNIFFEIIGTGQTFLSIKKLSNKLNLKNVLFREWIPYDKLITHISKADVCLGIFGNTEKAKRSVPNKIFESLAIAKPLITGNTPAVREILRNKTNCILCPIADPHALADLILLLHNNPQLRQKIAINGYELFKQKFTPKTIGKEIKEILVKSMKET